MVDLAMSIFEFLTKFLVIWHPWHPWVCIRSDLKPLETDMSDSSYCVIWGAHNEPITLTDRQDKLFVSSGYSLCCPPSLPYISFCQNGLYVFLNINCRRCFFQIYIVWYESPTMTVLETMTYPIEELTFPTVTLCPRNSKPDRWGPTIKLFDYMKKRCSTNG